jgi:hypothetical protein
MIVKIIRMIAPNLQYAHDTSIELGVKSACRLVDDGRGGNDEPSDSVDTLQGNVSRPV